MLCAVPHSVLLIVVHVPRLKTQDFLKSTLISERTISPPSRDTINKQIISKHQSGMSV